jgi:serine/threonine-protein kinase
VSRGPEPVEVPDLRGRGEQEARELLARAGLTVGVRTQAYDGADDPVPAGSVLRQVPAAGGTVARGSAVRLVVSQGPPLVAVPDVVGRQAAQARQLLREQGLDADVDRFLGGLFGAVSSQQPAAGSLVPRGTSVRLTVV